MALADQDCVAEPLPQDWWTTRDVATFLDVAPSTIRAYVTRVQVPGADRRIGREPVWRRTHPRSGMRERYGASAPATS